MNHTPRIVFPDADESTAALLVGARLERLEALGDFSLHIGAPGSPDAFVDAVGDAEAVMLGWSLPDAVLERAPNLKVIAFTGIGASNNINLGKAAQRGITVTNTPGYGDDTVAEHTMGLMLSCARHITTLDRDTRAGGWNKNRPGFDLKGKTLGLIGLGGIGARTAELANAFGMRVIAWTHNPTPQRAACAGVTFAALDEVLSRADVVSLHLALNEETHNMIDAARLARLKPSAIFVNTARGEIVDEAALIDALVNKRIAGAALDVFHEEPLPADHVFRSLDNVVITPHTGFNTPEANTAIIDIAIDSLAAYYNGAPINVVAGPNTL